MANTWNNPVIMQEAQALMALTDDLQKPFESAVSTLVGISGKIVCTGIGKSGSVAAKIADTMSSTGSLAAFLQPPEGEDGDIGDIQPNDAVLAFSRSGRAVEITAILKSAQRKNVPIVLVSENDQDSLAEYATVVLKMPPIDEAWGHAPTTSTILQMAIGDAIAVTVAQKKEFKEHASAIALAQKQSF